MKRKIFLIPLALLLAMSLVAIGCAAPAPAPEAYPERSINVLIGYGPGGGTDRFARAVGTPLTEIFGWGLVYVYLPGGAGSIAEDYVQKQPADGYTLLAMGGDFPINLVTGKTPYSLDSYIALCRVQQDTSTIQIRGDDDRFSNLEEFIAYAKEHDVNIGGTGAGGLDEVVTSLFIRDSGIKARYVTYEKAGKTHASLLAGDIDAMHEELGPVIGLVEAGDIKPIVIMSEERVADFPDLPTAVEMGWDITLGRWRGYLLKSGVPDDIVRQLEAAVYQAYETDDYKKWAKESYLHLRAGWLSSDDFLKLIKDEMKMYEELLTELGYL